MSTKLSQFDIALNALVSVNETEVVDREIVPVANNARPVTLTIGQLFTLIKDRKLKRALIQRNDEMRREQGRAKHVTREFHIAHVPLTLAWWKNRWHLVDGSHRAGHWFESLGCEVPSHVIVLAYNPRTEEEYLSLYAAIDSNKSTKTSRDYLFGYIRYLGAENKVSSHMVTTGSFVTAFDRLTNSKKHSQRIACMKVHLSAVQLLDKHRFRSEQVPQGFALAALRLYKKISDKSLVKSYIDGLAHAYCDGSEYSSKPIKEAFGEFESIRESFGKAGIGGSTATDIIGDALEAAFDRYTFAVCGISSASLLDPKTATASTLKLV